MRRSKTGKYKSYKKSTKREALRLYREFSGNAAKVSRSMGGHPSKGAILTWAEEEDWDGKIEESKKLVRKMLKVSDDPIVKQLAKDDIFVVEVLSLLQGIVIKSLKGKRKNKMYPRNSRELTDMLKFISTEYRLRTGSADSPAAQTSGQRGGTLREILETELGGGDDAKVAARGLVISLREQLRELRKKRLKASTEDIEKSS